MPLNNMGNMSRNISQNRIAILAVSHNLNNMESWPKYHNTIESLHFCPFQPRIGVPCPGSLTLTRTRTLFTLLLRRNFKIHNCGIRVRVRRTINVNQPIAAKSEGTTSTQTTPLATTGCAVKSDYLWKVSPTSQSGTFTCFGENGKNIGFDPISL